jgi:hypothetical protein
MKTYMNIGIASIATDRLRKILLIINKEDKNISNDTLLNGITRSLELGNRPINCTPDEEEEYLEFSY